ncbi:formyl transferase [Cladochytrium replicatum]|nr:formyl transferase [Cladochytrium replicatum]
MDRPSRSRPRQGRITESEFRGCDVADEAHLTESKPFVEPVLQRPCMALVQQLPVDVETHHHCAIATYQLFYAAKMPPRVVVLISWSGTNVRALIDATKASPPVLDVEVILVISNRKAAFGLTRAEKADIPTLVHTLKPYKDAGKPRVDYDVDLAAKIREAKPDLVVLAGWMHILSAEFLAEVGSSTVIERAFDHFRQGKAGTGVAGYTAVIHHVIPKVDGGAVIVEERFPVLYEDNWRIWNCESMPLSVEFWLRGSYIAS